MVPRVNSMVQSMERPYIDLTGSKEIPGKVFWRLTRMFTKTDLLVLVMNGEDTVSS